MDMAMTDDSRSVPPQRTVDCCASRCFLFFLVEGTRRVVAGCEA